MVSLIEHVILAGQDDAGLITALVALIGRSEVPPSLVRNSRAAGLTNRLRSLSAKRVWVNVLRPPRPTDNGQQGKLWSKCRIGINELRDESGEMRRLQVIYSSLPHNNS